MVLTHFGLNVAVDFNHQALKQGMVLFSLGWVWMNLFCCFRLFFNYNFYLEEARENSG